MALNPSSNPSTNSPRRSALFFLGGLLVIVLLLFHNSLHPAKVVFSNDGPLGAASAAALQPPASFLGMWVDLNWVGANGGTYPTGITGLLFWLMGPLYFSKFYAPFSVLFLGFSAWLLFRSLKLTPAACALGGLAAALNSTFFSAACWGVVTHPITIGVNYLALAALANGAGWRSWVKVALAGLAVGVGVTEGADIGAIFSLHVAAFVIYQAFTREGPVAERLSRGAARLGLVAVFAAFFAAQTLTTLIGTQIKGVAGAQEDQRTEERWDWSTQWSLPKKETLSVIIPGLFGYRMDTPDGGNYWGTIGRQPGWETHHQGFARYSGGGVYAGVAVAVAAVWALLQAFRRRDSAFTPAQRKLLWFWAAVLVAALLLAFGRHAPFYRVLYEMPYFSTIRNPAKFMHVFNWAFVIVFAYGVHGLWQSYVERLAAKPPNLPAGKKNAASSPPPPAPAGFDRKWLIGSYAAVAASLFGWLIYASSRNAVEAYMVANGFDASGTRAMAGHSLGEVGLFFVFLAVTVTVLAFIVKGRFAGARARWAAILLGLVLVVDLARANTPWIIYLNYREKYVSNPVVDFLRDKPYEHRVVTPRFGLGQQFQFFQQLYHVEWMQHLFQYYNIQSVDIVQESRVAADNAAYRQAFATNLVRLWQLTNTRYLFGLAGEFANALNQQLDPVQRRFQQRLAFALERGPTGETVIARTNDTGPFALLEYGGALPRAKLFTHWQTSTNDAATLQKLAEATFDPWQTVLVAEDIAPPAAPPATNQPAGAVAITSYAPKHLVLRANAAAPSMLLLNDKHDPNWRVTVDGQPARLLRCNYLMRGVALPAGEHAVEFHFQPPIGTLYITLAAIAAGAVLLALLLRPGRAAQTPAVTPRGA